MSSLRKPIFDPTDRLTFLVSTAVSLCIYLFSMGPSIGLEDAGELAAAANGPGIPHPPGYPLWTMLSWLFCRLFSFVTWQGYPNPAWAVTLASVIAGALAAGITALLIIRSSRDLLSTPDETEAAPVRTAAALAGIAGSLAFAFSPVMWSQSVIVEVYALGALFMALVLLMCYLWLRRPSRRCLVTLGLLFGLGLTNYQVLALAGIPLALTVFLRRRRLAFAFVALAVPMALTAFLLNLGAMPSADIWSTPGDSVILRPQSGSATAILYAAVTLLTLAAAVTASIRRFAHRSKIPLILLGITVAAAAWVVSPRILPDNFRGTLYPFIRAWIIHLAALGVLWFCCRHFVRTRRFALTITVVQTTLLCLMQLGLMFGLTHPTTLWFWWPIGWNLLLLWMAAHLLPQGKTAALTVLATELGVAVYAYLPLASDILQPAMNWGYPCTWEGFKHLISRGQYESLRPSSFLSLTYLRQLADYGRDLVLQFSLPVILLTIIGTTAAIFRTIHSHRRTACIWFGSTLLFFIVMSALLIALANPSGDLQDGFIQKVKFISSHGVFALWIGYALAMLLAWILKRSKYLMPASLLIAAAVVLAPVAENAFGKQLILTMGAAEQTGHDYGWQFGAYMLGGAPQILSELSEDEEPLPDPFWPPPMDKNALFFGGTDPGRFVPTYMTKAADYRPDIAVFTQNALADKTYMNGLRDLYGNHLWIPSAKDVRTAFTDYVDRVQSGKAETRGGTVTESNGRMRISGASAIMQINAELLRAMADRNPEHALYIEESYPVDWMKGRLESAGLAMRLVPQNTTNDETAVRDTDFWEWYMHRLTSERGYRRDFAAKKSFSKLRASLAGMYADRGMKRSAERAFRDTQVLYPESSEAIFRTIRETMIPSGKFETALRTLRRFRAADPKNARGIDLEERLSLMAETHREYTRLLGLVRAKTASVADIHTLAMCCETLGFHEGTAAYLKQITDADGLTANQARSACIALLRLREDEPALAFLKRIPESAWPALSETELLACSGLAQRFAEADLAFGLLKAALANAPQSGRVWLSVALFYNTLGNEEQTYDCMRNAVRFGAASAIESDPALTELFLRLSKRFGPQKGSAQ